MQTLSARAGYRRITFGPLALRLRLRPVVVCLALAGAIAAGAAWALLHGTLDIPARAALAALFGGEASREVIHVIVDVRLPRVLMAILVGAMLGLAGAAMQTLTRNGLADPGLIGVKEGASIGVLLVIFGAPALGIAWRPVAGLAGGLSAALLVCALARDLSGLRFLLVGIGLAWLLSAVLLIFLTTADINDVETALLWLAGSLHNAAWPALPAALFWGAVGTLALATTARQADAALLGDAAARGLGVRLKGLNGLRLAASALMTAAAVSCVGSLGFVGLMAPHMARLMVGGGQGALLTGSALCGGLLVLAADTFGRLAFAPLQIPAGIVMAVFGVPVFLLLLWHRRDRL